MRKHIITTTLIFSFFVAPLGALAHGGTADNNFSEAQTAPQMMRYIEEQALENDKTHKEMEQLMVQMMRGELTQPQADRMVELMESYPGVHSVMMGRLSAADGTLMGQHMGTGAPAGGVGVLGWLLIASAVVWLIAGLMFVAHLGRKISQ